MTPEAYREQYLAPLHDSRVARPREPLSVPPGLWFRPVRAEPSVSLQDLYNAGIRSGHGETRALLESRLEGFDAVAQEREAALRRPGNQLTSVQAELDDARRLADRHERALQGALQAARDRIDELESSTFWRMTGPLRAALPPLKRTSLALRALPQGARLMRSRLATAHTIAKDQGVGELAR